MRLAEWNIFLMTNTFTNIHSKIRAQLLVLDNEYEHEFVTYQLCWTYTASQIRGPQKRYHLLCTLYQYVAEALDGCIGCNCAHQLLDESTHAANTF